MTYIPPEISYSLPEKHKLPCNTATWTVTPGRAVLLLHDMQHFFLKPFEKGMKMKLIRNVSAVRKWAEKMNIQIAYSAQPGGMTEKQRRLLKDFWK